jgi:putative endonuclease
VGWLAQLMYHALVWKERQRAHRSRTLPATGPGKQDHLDKGQRGETLAYWFLRHEGYTIVARNRRARSGAGEIDLIGWDGPVLAFVEVKTRKSLEAGLPEAAVSKTKQKRVAKAAGEYVRRLGRKPVSYRFDIVSILWDPVQGLRARLIKDAFKG